MRATSCKSHAALQQHWCSPCHASGMAWSPITCCAADVCANGCAHARHRHNELIKIEDPPAALDWSTVALAGSICLLNNNQMQQSKQNQRQLQPMSLTCTKASFTKRCWQKAVLQAIQLQQPHHQSVHHNLHDAIQGPSRHSSIYNDSYILSTRSLHTTLEQAADDCCSSLLGSNVGAEQGSQLDEASPSVCVWAGKQPVHSERWLQ